MGTIGQAPREDVVPEMAELIGPGVEILEGGALDGLGRAELAGLAPEGDQEILVTRLADASSVFVAKEKITPLVQRRIDELEAAGAAMTVVLCAGALKGLRGSRAVVRPEKFLVGLLPASRFPDVSGSSVPRRGTCPRRTRGGAGTASIPWWCRCRRTITARTRAPRT